MRQTRRQIVRALTAVTGGLLLARAGGKGVAWPALAQEDDDDGSGRGRGRGRGGHGDDDEQTAAPAIAIPPGSVEIRIVSDDPGGFTPAEVTIDPGQAVTFVNAHSDEHTATGAGFDTGIIPEGGSATITFDDPGTYVYACQIHPEMTGSIAVRGADGVVPQRAATPPAAPAGGEGVSVSIANLAFNPSSVSAQTGQSVTWRNDDGLPHTVTALDGQFDSGILEPGASFSWTFVAPGEVAYQCQLHPTMRGSVTVEGSAVVVATPAVEQSGTAAPGVALEGVWLVEFVPDDTTRLAAHQALLTLHPDGLVQADFAVQGMAAPPEAMLRAGHGEWRSAGDDVTIALLALLVDGEERFMGTVTIRAQVQVSAANGGISGTFAFVRSSAHGQAEGEGTGELQGGFAMLEAVRE